MNLVVGLQNAQPFIVTLVDKPTPQTTLGDVIVGAFAIAGLLVLAGVILGVAVGLIRVKWKARHPPDQKHVPSISSLLEK